MRDSWASCRRSIPWPLAVLLGVALFGCNNEISAELSIDGEAVTLSSCRSGRVYGFVGVELVTEGGAKVRIAQSPTNAAQVFLIPAGSERGAEIGECGTFEVHDQNSSINDVTNVKGSADLDCTGSGHELQGSVQFANCH